MKDILSGAEAAKVIGCTPTKVYERMKRGLWDIGMVYTKEETGQSKTTYEIYNYRLADFLGISIQEVERRRQGC